MQTTTRDLSTGWQVRDIPREGASPTTHLPWLPATVPGHVHLDLQRAGVIPDPFVRLHERDVAWVDETDWVYEMTFHMDEAPAHAYLKFHGLDTLAEITLNGELLGRTQNMFIPHEFPVGGKLKVGDNHLRVTFASALRVGRERQAAYDASGEDTFRQDWFLFGSRSFVRKSQYMYGWDWGPELLGCGIWGKVELVTVPVARITDWKYDVEFTDDNKAIVTVTADIERAPGAEDRSVTFTAAIQSVHSNRKQASAYVQPAFIRIASGQNQVSRQLIITIPQRWKPGEQVLPTCYTLKLALADAGDIDSCTSRIGLRTIELICDTDADGKGEGFKFRVNGEDVYSKGANWIPDSSYPGTISYLHLRDRLTQIKEAGFNMLRVWGGGLYESEDFYNMCDFLGILVWQDFPYACAYYPDTGEYAEEGRREAIAAVKRIRNHPCLALWCGNNENDQVYYDKWGGQPAARYLGDYFYRDILPAIVAAEDPKTPYWPSSPTGGTHEDGSGNPNSSDYGDVHNWDVWHGRGDYIYYAESNARFVSEFGFASSCGLAAWDTVLAPEDKHPESAAVRWHDKTRKGYDVFRGYVDIHYPHAKTLEDWVYYSQCNQADALKFGIEHYRRLKGRNWGVLFWQINDCWPTQSWAVIDSLGEPKAAYFAAKKFYAPVLLSLVKKEGVVEAHLTSDLRTALSGEVRLALRTFEGETLAEALFPASVEPNGTAAVAALDITAGTGLGRETYVEARFMPADGSEVRENILLLAEPKELRLADPALKVTLKEEKYAFMVTVSAERFAPYVWLRCSDNTPLIGISDNFFHLRPGETREIVMEKTDTLKTIEDLRGRLIARTL